ncbi:hypothetical protein Y032_0183g949 [Ancylostoma ceylanicum]|uniref:Uncharacterized protein n=1 Tax=Ancylostoma ceylanicum TaxID=53326 RepID=A0A016SSN0_9BILA|nr:hypothetical protein Y032_0183g949 [Ancylostoma ceylanicum]
MAEFARNETSICLERHSLTKKLQAVQRRRFSYGRLCVELTWSAICALLSTNRVAIVSSDASKRNPSRSDKGTSDEGTSPESGVNAVLPNTSSLSGSHRHSPKHIWKSLNRASQRTTNSTDSQRGMKGRKSFVIAKHSFRMFTFGFRTEIQNVNDGESLRCNHPSDGFKEAFAEVWDQSKRFV